MTSMYVRIEARLDHLLDSLDQLAKKENEKLEKKRGLIPLNKGL